MNPNSSKNKILFLYTELADYVVNCMKYASLEFNLEFHVVRWPINKEAPFSFNMDGISVYERNDYSEVNQLIQLADKISPNLIVCSGWVDKDYLKVCKTFKNTLPIVMTLDNKWNGSLKQHLASLVGPFFIKSNFHFGWVPGKSQEEYITKLGFSKDSIRQGYYTANTDYFKNIKQSKDENLPKRFIYVGRYVEHKGIFDLWEAFAQLQKEFPSDWELWCLGTGDCYDRRVTHPKIKHFGFIQPTEMEHYLKESGVFVLPSHFEPWGVVVHEFASAGFPIISSDKVGASEAFVIDNVSGFIFPSGNVQALKERMKMVIEMSNDKLLKMGDESAVLSEKITPHKWGESLLWFLNQKRN